MPLIPMTIQEQVAKDVAHARRLMQLTQHQLAEKVGTSQAAIARLESSAGNPTVDLIQRVVTALDMNLTIFVRPQR